MLTLIEYMEWYHIDFGRIGSTLVWSIYHIFEYISYILPIIGAYLNLNVSWLGVLCTMTLSQLHTRLLFDYNDNDERLCANVVLIDFGWTVSTFVLVHVWSRMYHCLVYDTLYPTPSQLHTRLLLNYNGNDIRLCAIVLTLDEQAVRCNWRMFEVNVSLFGLWYWIYL